MSHISSSLLIGSLCIICSLCLAADGVDDKLLIHQPYSLATPPSASVAVGYMQLTNNGTEPELLLGASSELAKDVQLHETIISGDVAKMRKLEDGLLIGPGESVALEPGSYHLMFMQPVKPLKEGDMFSVTLLFGDSKEMTFMMEVRKMSMGSGHGEHKAPGKTDQGKTDHGMKHGHQKQSTN